MKPMLRTLLLFLCATTLTALSLKAQIASISTDLPDYPPGATVVISGSGFQGGEEIQLQIIHTDGFGDNTAPHHQPFFATANPDGTVLSSWYIPIDQDELGATWDPLESTCRHASLSIL